MAATVDKLLATPEARAKLMRFFISWLEVREPDRVHDRADGVPRVHAGARRRDGGRGQGVPERAALQGGAHAEGRDPVDAVVRLGRAGVDLRRGRVGRDQADVAGPEAAARHLHAAGRDHLALGARHDAPGEARRVLHAQGDVHAARPAAARRQHHDPRHRDGHGTAEGRERDPDAARARPATASSTRSASCRRTSTPLGRWRTLDNGLPIDAERLGRLPRRGAVHAPARRSTRSRASPARCASSSASSRQLFRFYTGRDETAADDPVLRQMFFEFANNDEQAIVQLLRALATLDQLLAAIGDAMTRRTLKEGITRRDLIKRFGFAGVPAHAGRARDGLRRGRHVRGRAALRDVLQGRRRSTRPSTNPSSITQPGRDADRAAAAARATTSSCSRA